LIQIKKGIDTKTSTTCSKGGKSNGKERVEVFKYYRPIVITEDVDTATIDKDEARKRGEMELD